MGYPLQSLQLLQNFQVVLPVLGKTEARGQHNVPPAVVACSPRARESGHKPQTNSKNRQNFPRQKKSNKCALRKEPGPCLRVDLRTPASRAFPKRVAQKLATAPTTPDPTNGAPAPSKPAGPGVRKYCVAPMVRGLPTWNEPPTKHEGQQAEPAKSF